jgi:hypothetical protein
MALRPSLKLGPIDLLSPIGFGVEDESEEQPFGEGGGLFPPKNARGAQENLWPKFFLWSAPLRATSSV